MNLHILGIRHHGVGSGAHLLRRLYEIKPDHIIIEGPVELTDTVAGVDLTEFKPPVAILGYNPADLSQSLFYPYAAYSPEWQALLYAQEHGVEYTMADMPLKFQFGYTREEGEGVGEQTHPIDEIARLEGYESGELWWEHRFEQRRSDPAEHFEAVMVLMRTLREHYGREDGYNDIREAFMREAIRSAKGAKRERVVFVCGAWHAPALEAYADIPAKADKELIKGLPSAKVETTWIPWLNSRLSWRSGYGAGIDSAGWYDYLHRYPEDDGTIWLYKASKLFRKRKMDISTAHTIETLRTAHSLAALRGLSRAGLRELSDAILTVMCEGDEILLDLIRDELIVGKAIGKVPENSSTLPLLGDFEASIKSYRLKKLDEEKSYTLDLRNETHLAKSIFLHRLAILGLPWGRLAASHTKGTFKEVWVLKWQPGYELELIDKAIWGNSVESATQNYIRDMAARSQDSVELGRLIDLSLTARLFESVSFLIERIDALISLSHDVSQLIATLLPLMVISRYDDIRKLDKSILETLIEALIVKITVNLPNACYGLEYTSAKELLTLIASLHEEMRLIEEQERYDAWIRTLESIARDMTMPTLIRGRITSLLFNAKHLELDELKLLLSQALSTGADTLDSVYWIEGLLEGSAVILLIDDNLWNILYGWLEGLSDEEFDHILPILRRTFSGYDPKIRRDLGAKAKAGLGQGETDEQQQVEFDTARAEHSLEKIKGWLYYA